MQRPIQHNTKKSTPTMRRKARALALQAIYQWQLTLDPILEIQNQFMENPSLGKADTDYFLELLQSIPKSADTLDAYIKPILDRQISELNPVELSILRIGTYELVNRLDIPYKVVIDEALRLAKTFGATDGFRYVNAILDKLASQLRPVENRNKQ